MNVAGAECEGVMHESGVHGLLGALGDVEEVGQVAEVTVTTTHAVASAVLVQHEHLPR